MSRKRPGLGKGLDALIPRNITDPASRQDHKINFVATHSIKLILGNQDRISTI